MLSEKKSTFIFLFTLFSITALSQGDFRQGYIIRNNGDSVAGWVDYRNAKRSERVCTFKSSPKAPKEKLTPKDIKAYGIIGDRIYVVKTLPVLNGNPVTGFVNFLADGALKLYSFQGIYYVETDSIILLPPTYSKDVTVKGKAYKQTVKPYINILNRLLAPCQLLATRT